MRRRGFSLLETVFSSALLAAVMLMLFNLYPSSALAVRRSQNQLQADQIGESLLAEQQALPFTQLRSTAPDELPDVTQGGTVYKRQVEVFTIAGSDPELLKGVRGIVTWEWVRGTQRSVYETHVVKLEN